jgi:hypothetical protein
VLVRKGGGMNTRELHLTIRELVEMDHEQRAAQERLREFQDTNNPPLVPDQFNSLGDFLNFHSRGQNYEKTIRRFHAEHDQAEQLYNEASRELSKFLPPHVPLRYAYDGDHEELEGLQFTIENMDQLGTGQIRISPNRPE